MQQKKRKQLYLIPLEFANGMSRTVKVKSTSRENAEKRALKFNPGALGVKQNA